jgi:adenylate cyclase
MWAARNGSTSPSAGRRSTRPILVSADFPAACGDQRAHLVSFGRYALRGVVRPQELFILDLQRSDPADT